MKSLLLMLAFAFFAAAAPTQPDELPEVNPPLSATQAVRFATFDVVIDPKGQPLAAYQLELTADSPHVKLAGIEGGEHTAFRDPPYYDPAAMSRNRVILAAFNTGSDLPKQPFRAARLHVQISDHATPKWEVKLTVASSADGTSLRDATATASPSSPSSEGAVP